MKEQLNNILAMITDVERGNWPAKVAILEIKKVVAALAEQARAAEQHTMCAVCGKDKHTPLRRDDMGGYVCLTCIDKELDERPIPAEQPTQPPAQPCRHCGSTSNAGGRYLDQTLCGECYNSRHITWDVPTQPPAGDVVERMLDAFMPGWRCEPSPERQRKNMTAALAVAQQERDAQWEKAIMCAPEYPYGTWDGWILDDDQKNKKVRGTVEGDDVLIRRADALNAVRARLAKPAERTVIVDGDAVDQWYVALDRTPLNVKFTNKRDAERYAAGLREELRDGKEGK